MNTPTLFLGGIAVAALRVLSLEGASLAAETRGPEDLAVEDCLSHGVVVEEFEVPIGITTPKGRDGALVQWLENASMEAQLGRSLTTQERIDLARQKSTMHLFDALICNTDRRPENWLIGHDDLKLYLIDHSRAFRTQTELPEDFVKRPARISRSVYTRLQDLSEASVTDLLEGLIDRAQIRALLARRDRILQKVSQDIETHGPDTILSD